MNKKEFLKNIRKQIHFVFDRDSIEKEFNAHIEDSILDLTEDGYLKEEAEKIAIEQMGDPIEIGKALNEEHHPLLGWVWLFSKIALLILLIPTFFFVRTATWDIYEYLWTMETSKDKIVLDLEIDLEAHTVTINEILDEGNDEYCLIYHALSKWNVNRTGVMDELFYITDNEGNIYDLNYRPTHHINVFFGCQGEKWFVKPKDGIIYLEFTNGNQVKIDLKEYPYE